MSSFLRIGYVTFFSVAKALPGYDNYLCKIESSQALALLPKKYTIRDYKVGEKGFASIYDIKGAQIFLSQVSVHYARKVLEYLLAPALKDLKLRIKKSAWINDASYRKVAIEVLDEESDIKDSFQLYKTLKPYLEKINFSDYFRGSIGFVCYSKDIKEFVKNALCPPGHLDKIYKVTVHRESDKVSILVDDSILGLIVGKNATNLILAKKLCNCDIEITGINMNIILSYRNKNN